MTTGTVYSRTDYATVDIGAQMRLGHPYIATGDAHIVAMVERLAKSRGGIPRVFEVGSGSGYLTGLLLRAVPEAELIANEIEPSLVALARRRFAGTKVTVFDRPFECWNEPVDILISWGSHHHLSSLTHLAHAASLIGTSGVLILGDEFCPDYLDESDRLRIARAEIIQLANGYLLTTSAEVAAFKDAGIIPEWSIRLERRRRHALWTWYKHVVDFAFEKDDDIVVQAELQIAADDLRTEFSGEHKIALSIVLRDLELNGFVERSRLVLETEPALASFFILTLVTAHGHSELVPKTDASSRNEALGQATLIQSPASTVTT
jgi:SAM-dependent methyltransferase